MFIMDVPYVPAQDTSIVVAQAAAPSATTQPDYLLKICQETEHTSDPRSALRGVDPAGWLAVYLENRDGKVVDLVSIKNLTMLQGTKHGKIFSEIDNVGLTAYHYDPEAGYLGDDQAIFMAEFQGKRYKIVVDIKVLDVVVENLHVCPPPQLIKVNGKPVSGSSSYDLNTIPVTFADLSGSALGQTNTNGITLDTNAANYNWFIDTTPWDYSEFLPTSNPNEWVARVGSAAYGGMYY
jgi:hypothetical protein